MKYALYALLTVSLTLTSVMANEPSPELIRSNESAEIKRSQVTGDRANRSPAIENLPEYAELGTDGISDGLILGQFTFGQAITD